jgi:hypothetical protein
LHAKLKASILPVSPQLSLAFPEHLEYRGVRLSLVHPLFHTKFDWYICLLYLTHPWSKKGVGSAQKTQVGPCIPVGVSAATKG